MNVLCLEHLHLVPKLLFPSVSWTFVTLIVAKDKVSNF